MVSISDKTTECRASECDHRPPPPRGHRGPRQKWLMCAPRTDAMDGNSAHSRPVSGARRVARSRPGCGKREERQSFMNVSLGALNITLHRRWSCNGDRDSTRTR